MAREVGFDLLTQEYVDNTDESGSNNDDSSIGDEQDGDGGRIGDEQDGDVSDRNVTTDSMADHDGMFHGNAERMLNEMVDL